jgi:hypothetical protein
VSNLLKIFMETRKQAPIVFGRFYRFDSQPTILGGTSEKHTRRNKSHTAPNL